VLKAGFALLVVADLVLAFAEGFYGMAAGVILWGLHMGFTQGPLSALVADTAPPELRGTAYGLFNLLSGFVLFVASALAGGLWERVGPQSTFATGAGFTVVALLALSFAGVAWPGLGRSAKS
jgi:MFS family permease